MELCNSRCLCPFLLPRYQDTRSFSLLCPLLRCVSFPRAQMQGAKWPQTTNFETVSQKKHFLYINWLRYLLEGQKVGLYSYHLDNSRPWVLCEHSFYGIASIAPLPWSGRQTPSLPASLQISPLLMVSPLLMAMHLFPSRTNLSEASWLWHKIDA